MASKHWMWSQLGISEVATISDVYDKLCLPALTCRHLFIAGEKYITSDGVYVEKKIVFYNQKHATSKSVIVLSVSIIISMEIRNIIFKASVIPGFSFT